MTTLGSLPDLASDYPLTAAHREHYQRDGHILLRGVCSLPEAQAYRPVIADYVRRASGDVLPLDQRDTYHKAFLQVANLWEHDPAAARFTLARRFGKIAADLMGVEGVRLYHDQALFKEPGGGPTPWHQDQFYWPLDTVHTVTLWMPLVDVPVEMGALTFATGSQVEGRFAQLAISDESESFYEQLVRDKGYRIHNEPMKAGDATFHTGWTLHCAPGNATDRMREVMTIIYYADGTKILDPDNFNRGRDLQRWHPGQKPGELAASRINPLIYHRTLKP